MSCLAIYCDATGRILDILCDDTGVFCEPGYSGLDGDTRAALRGSMLSGYVAPGGAQHFTHLLARVGEKGAVGEWLLDMQGSGQVTSLRLWAATQSSGASPDVLLLGTADASADVAQVADAVPVAVPDAAQEAGGAALAAEAEGAAALAALVQRIRAHAADGAALRDDLRAQAAGLKQQIQPPPMVEHRLLSMAAHDLRNPLLVLSMGCSYLLHDARCLNDEQRTILRESLESCEFMNRLVEGMIELAHVAVGSVALNREITDLVTLVEQGIRHHAPVGRERGISVELVRAAPATADVDPMRIGQVVNQLLNNTLTHCPEGTRVRVWLDRDGGEIVLGVEDDGPGIAPEIRELLFRPLGKPHTTLDPKRYGAGMGLAIARYIIEGHDGTIDVVTEVGKGSRFEVRLPAGD